MIAELASILALIVVAILWKYHQWRTSPLFRIPGPKCNFTFKEWVVGVFHIIQNEPFMQPQQRWWKESGPDTQMMHVTGVFGRHFIFVLDADGVKQVLSSKAGGKLPRFIKGLEFLKKVIGEGLVTIDGDEWQRHRKIMQPIFDNQVLKEALNSCLPDIMDRFVAAWKEKAGGELDLTSHCAALALDIIGKVAFSHDFQAVTSVEQWAKGAVRQVELNDPLIKSLYTSMMPSMLRMLFVNLRLGALERFYLRESFNAQVILDREFATVVDRSYARYIRRDKASTESKCLLDYLFDAQTASRAGSTSNSLTHKELQGEMKTLIFAGHETTATLCVWAIFSIIKHKEVEHLVVDDILKHSPKNARMTFESVEKMDYLDAFLKEVLRLHPP
ncbi:hypothetical protein ACHAWU_005550 [Discostella pseudostelligera]|uniref:Cytochrome P450 n=1 Tax=Discostella pseudostelligera TaxID=259834 RepID=A0ABD3NAI0_9STRA